MKPPATNHAEAIDAAYELPDTATQTDETPNVGSGTTLSTTKAAQLLGVHPATLARNAGAYGGRRGPKGHWQFEVERIRVAGGSSAPASGGKRKQETGAGENEASAVALFRQGATIADVCVLVKIPLEEVTRIRAAWIKSQRADYDDCPFPCQACKTGPGNPAFALCTTCGEKFIPEILELRSANQRLRDELEHLREVASREKDHEQ